MPNDKKYLSDVKMILKVLYKNQKKFNSFVSCEGFVDTMNNTFGILNIVLKTNEKKLEKTRFLYVDTKNDYYIFNYCFFEIVDQMENSFEIVDQMETGYDAFRGETCIIKKDFSSFYFINETFFKEDTNERNISLNSLVISKYFKVKNNLFYKSIKYDYDSLKPNSFIYENFGNLIQQNQELIINEFDEVLKESNLIK